MADLAGRTAIVTGRGTGIGEACARALSAAGAAVLVADIDELSAHAVAEQISAGGGRAEAHRADVTVVDDVDDVDDVDEMVEHCLAEFGALHVAVNNAGIHGDPANPSVADYPVAWWDRILATNLSSIFYCLRAEIRAMCETGDGGSIVNMASIFGQVATIADLVTFLAGDGASFLTGAYYPAEGGFLAR
jgi:NAD(P)-dependent dehydrogenase (short-subunit alcohol dehydrogenase family)